MQFEHFTVHNKCKERTFLNSTNRDPKTYDGTDLGKALFFAIKHRDYDLAIYLIKKGAPLNKSFQVSEGNYLTTLSLLVKIMCEARVQKGVKELAYKLPDKILDIFIGLDVDLRCHCSLKFQHKCPLFIALNELQIKCELDIFQPKNILIRKLIVNGATLKKKWEARRKDILPWFDIDQVRSYLLTSQIQQQEKDLEKASLSSSPSKQKQQQQQSDKQKK